MIRGARALDQRLGLREEGGRSVVVVELAGDVAGQLQVLLLVLAHRHVGGLVDQDVGGLQHRIGVEADAGALLVLAALLLELGHAVQPAQAGHALEDPGQFGMLAHRRLREDGGLGRVEAGGQVGGGDLAGLLGQQGRILPDGDGVQVGHEDEGVHLVLQPGELHQGAQIVAQVQGAGRLDAGEHAGRARIGNGGVVGHGFSLGT
jgi:hypothetical protein